MKNKGFTLIELLGVIIILALLMTLVFPSIVNLVKNSSDKTDDLTLDLIYNAVDMYISNHSTNFSKTEGKKFSIDLKDLVDENYLASPIKLSDSDSDITNNKCVQVVYNNGYKYELKNKGECEKTCMPVTTATTGNIPQNDGTYRAGDEYICEVAPNIKYRFFVLTTTTNPEKVDMIMYANINKLGQPVDNNSVEDKGLVAWVSKEDYFAAGGTVTDYGTRGNTNKGPITAMNYLAKVTSNWTNLQKQTVSKITFYTADAALAGNPHNSTINMNAIESYARLPYHSEVYNGIENISNKKYIYDYFDCNSTDEKFICYNSNIMTNIISATDGYWLLSIMNRNGVNLAMDVDSNIQSIDGKTSQLGNSPSDSDINGVRPVITVLISDIG